VFPKDFWCVLGKPFERDIYPPRQALAAPCVDASDIEVAESCARVSRQHICKALVRGHRTTLWLSFSLTEVSRELTLEPPELGLKVGVAKSRGEQTAQRLAGVERIYLVRLGPTS
jgi:hypothetical protein